VPGQWSEADFGRGRLTVRVVARLAPGVTLEQAGEAMSALATRLAENYPDSNAGMGANILSLEEYQVGDIRTWLLMLLAAVAMVLLIACVNVSNLVLQWCCSSPV
jgi:putative ABC transport system permease protein